eukprot:GHVU01033399.1.p1 GENE.GHVU01033399.1~~GHVU01033399.1.p1  ORF type:complete len:157 (+),score=9.76 GHVU01033399.1:411-881(+)
MSMFEEKPSLESLRLSAFLALPFSKRFVLDKHLFDGTFSWKHAPLSLFQAVNDVSVERLQKNGTLRDLAETISRRNYVKPSKAAAQAPNSPNGNEFDYEVIIHANGTIEMTDPVPSNSTNRLMECLGRDRFLRVYLAEDVRKRLIGDDCDADAFHW